MAVAATTALRPTSLASPSASTDFTPRSKSSLRTTTLAYEQRVSVAKTIRASLPFSVIFNGWFESPSANIAWPAASTCATLAPPPGAMKNGTATPSSSKNFFSLATRCWPYTKVETLCETVMGFGACARAGARQAAATAAAPEAVRKRRRSTSCAILLELRPDAAIRGVATGAVHAARAAPVNRNILTLQRISAMLGFFHGPEHDRVRAGGGERRVDRRYRGGPVRQSPPPRCRTASAARLRRARAGGAPARAEPAGARTRRRQRAAHAARRRRRAARAGGRGPRARVRRPRPRAGAGARSRGRAEPGLGARAAGRRAARGAGARRAGGAVAAPGRGARTRARRAGGAAHRRRRPAGGCAAHAARRADGRRGRRG